MPKSQRHQHAARKAALTKVPERKLYVITDPYHQPDLRGEFAGVKVQRDGHVQMVRLTDAQAKFYLDQGAIQPLAS